MKILVVTGGIGSGKSEVCRIMCRMGLDLQYNADSRVKMLYTAHPGLLEDIEPELGCSLRDHECNFVPSKLAARIFEDKDAMTLVEDLVFPALLEDFEFFCSSHHQREIVVFESATVLEKARFEGFGDYVILVDAPFDVRLARACARDNADQEAILARMKNQSLMNSFSAGHTDQRIDAVIMNDGSLEDLQIKTELTIRSLLKDMNINIETD